MTTAPYARQSFNRWIARTSPRGGGQRLLHVSPLFLSLFILLVGCVPPAPSTPDVLHLAHVTPLLDGAPLPAGALFALAGVTTPTTNGQPAMLVGGGTSSDGLLVPLSGGRVRAFAHGGGCQLAVSVWQQGKLVACVASHTLSAFAPDGSGPVGTISPSGGTGDDFIAVSWEPSGSYVDALEQVSALAFTAEPSTLPGVHCLLDQFAVGMIHPLGAYEPTLALTGRLELPADIRWCGSLAWAPDGTSLALRGFTSDTTVPPPYPTPAPTSIPSPTHVFLVSGPSLLAQLSAATPPSSVTSALPMLQGLRAAAVTLPYVAVPQAMAWEPSGDWLTVAAGTRVLEVNAVSGEKRDLFTVPSGEGAGADVCALAWTPDGRGLAFIHCIPYGGGEHPAPPGRLYLYTPSAP